MMLLLLDHYYYYTNLGLYQLMHILLVLNQ